MAQPNVIEEQPDLPWHEEEAEAGKVPQVAPRVVPPTKSPEVVAAATAAAEADAKRRAGLLENVKHDYRVIGDAFYFRERPDMLAFKDGGSKLVTSHNSSQVALSMAALAEAKGWKGITVSGHADFRREVWLEARLRGISVVGYEPKPQDKEELAARLDGLMKNTVTAARAIGAVGADRPSPKPSTSPAQAAVAQRAPQKAPAGKEHAFLEAMRFMTGDAMSSVRVSKEGVDVAQKVLKEEKVPVGDEERRRIVKAVAQVVAERKGASPAVVKAVVAQVEKVIDRRVAEGRGVPRVPVYDAKASPAKQQDEVQPTQHSSRSR
jgi:hypothetical protein